MGSVAGNVKPAALQWPVYPRGKQECNWDALHIPLFLEFDHDETGKAFKANSQPFEQWFHASLELRVHCVVQCNR